MTGAAKAPGIGGTKLRDCTLLLKKLMTHSYGWVFNMPVDPVKLCIPDYFTIISKPMDLGTVKWRLEKRVYADTHMFAADVKLTFSNALHYNPPGNDVHEMAKQLDVFFASRWKELEAKWGQAAPAALHKTVSGGVLKKGVSALKNDLKNDLGKLSGKRNPPHLVKSITKTEDALVQLNQTGRSYADNRFVELGRLVLCFSVFAFLQYSVLTWRQVVPTTLRHWTRAEVHSTSDCVQSDSSGEKLKTHQSHLTDPDTEGVMSAEEGKSWLTSCPVAPTSLPVEGDDYSCDQQLSPKKALRAAMLKKRFADTILKAQQKTLLENGKKSDPVQVKDQLEKKKREEKARLLAQIKAAEVEARRKVEAEAKLQREREREAARIALQKMVKTVDIDENLSILKDILMFGYPSSPVDAINGHERRSPLEEIGLYLKEDWY
ncbi:Transcription factor GTE12 [Acorus calamus]|uniref:Transcription factor GTE12 n=1 Tax=Acorus calamus TaxID=4465 RepID=A0AAV9EAF9_ACOCL|nr:Transcription factor GTE12 [Acorus calamus]